jgi:hypothetical protein
MTISASRHQSTELTLLAKKRNWPLTLIAQAVDKGRSSYDVAWWQFSRPVCSSILKLKLLPGMKAITS